MVQELPAIPITVRPYRESDAAVCRRLYLEGRIGGTRALNDTGVDVDDITSAYMRQPGGHFWVAETEEAEVVGMIGVQQHVSGEGEIRRLRVRKDVRRRGIGSALLETALKFCRDSQYLKITLDTYTEPEPALKLFEKFHFRHSRTREIGNKTLLYFYLDLYSRDRPGAVKTG